MRRPSLALGALLGAVSSVVVMLLAYFGNQLAGLPSVAFDLFDWLARVLPGAVVNFGIDLMVSIIRTLQLGPTANIAKLAEGSIAVVQFIVLGAVFGAILAALKRNNPTGKPLYGLLGGFILFLVVGWIKSSLGFGPGGEMLDLFWLAILFLGWGWSLDTLLGLRAAEAPAAGPAPQLSRRRFIYLTGSAGLAAALMIVGLVAYLRRGSGPQVATEPSTTIGPGQTNGPAASPPATVLNARIQPAPGTRPELTPTGAFYRIDINIIPPRVDSRTWRLKLEGLVNRPLSLSLDDIRSRPAISQVLTLSCISNAVGGDLISTSRWTGTPLREVLSEAGLKDDAAFVNITSADGFYESLRLAEAMDERILLVYDMDGFPLSAEHGFPLRIYIPDLYGMKQPKWITKIKVANYDGSGYWVDRSWSKTAAVNTTSVTDAVSAANPDRTVSTVPVGGIAYAGAKGISRVEVQMDDGPWVEAKLRLPPLSPLTWVQWRYDFPYKSGTHTFRVRAYDGKGKLQTLEPHDTFPDGATGIHSRMAVI
ncbi:MAG: molybdopterin-dependent oxidoreductase [Chloroflexi bacterium]|nr:molybdopterin-dependent oxidoreductase [Chloroflexota bacterium]